MEQSEGEVFYETRYHASRPCSSNYPPRPQQVNEAGNRGFLSLLSRSGVGQLKEKWSGYRNKKKLRKWVSLFVSPRGERVAVAMGSQITILNKNDDYHEPQGTFTSSNSNSFTCGTWSESHDVLGVLDDLGVLYFIRANGEEITRITRAHLKPSLPIIGVIMMDGADMEKSCLCSFNVLTSDGSLHEVEISQDLHSSISSSSTLRDASSASSSKRGFPDNVICVNYHTDLSLLVVIGDGVGGPMNSATGTCSLSLWRRIRNFDLEPIFSMQIEGWYSKPKGYVGKISCPKVLISPQGKFVASLDIRGYLVIFKLDDGRFSPLSHRGGEKFDSFGPGDSLDKEGQSLTDIVDFTWWSDYVLVLSRRSGSINMISTCSGMKVLHNDPVFSMPILERVQHVPGHVFLLEMIPSQEKSDLSSKVVLNTVQDIDWVIEDNNSPHNIDKLHWNLVSFSKRSVSEMFDVLISSQKFQAALDFANCHGLEKDKVLKSQWLHSVQGLNEINTFLARIKDQAFVLSECLERIGPTEDAMRALLTMGIKLTNQHADLDSDINENSQTWEFCLARLKFLQFRDKLETFLGINMGRFSMQEYRKFRVVPIREAAVTLAESGKIGALNLLFKRHPYSLMPFMLEILDSIPETVPVQSYQQLLPGNSPPPIVSLREKDWVECQEVARYITQLPENHERKTLLKTEPIVKHFLGFSWPTTDDLSSWYKSRASDMDSLSGQLDNCLCLVDIACSKGIPQLKHFYENISYLHHLIYSDTTSDEASYTMSLAAWEQLSDYEKFKMMLTGTKEENVVGRLREKAIPFMESRCHTRLSVSEDAVSGEHANADVQTDTFLVTWLKETASENRLDLCLKVIEEGSIEFQDNIFFKDMNEAVDCALHCIYLCTVADKWTTMSLILSKLPEMRDSDTYTRRLKKRVKQVEGHIESGRLLSFYQVPKTIGYFLEEHSDGKGVKQILRLILSKFIRRQPGRSDSEWANMWRDFLVLQEKAFPFLDQEYMLMEFCRGLLKAGKFSLARNYLRGTASVPLATEKAENIVIQAAREYFFSASSLSCTEIWKAKECLSLLPSSRNVRAEADIIDALTVKLPNLGVSILPMQFRQVKDPMEIIKLAITSQVGAYLNVDELIEIAKLLGLSSQDDISVVQETIAREAAVAGDLQLAFDLCIILAKKNHGPIWDLCAAMARGPNMENMDITSRKQLLGFALSHCDEESIGELLNAWKDLDLQGQIQMLTALSKKDSPGYAFGGASAAFPSHSPLNHQLNHREYLELANTMSFSEQESSITNMEKAVASVAKDFPLDRRQDWETLLSENASFFSFASVQLQWLLELCAQAGQSGKVLTNSEPGRQDTNVKVQALVTILSWLAKHNLTPKDDLIASLAKSFLEPPATEEEDIMGCSFLLNLLDAFGGVEIIEQQMRTREEYDQICSIMGVGMIYGVLHNAAVRCEGPMQRRELLLKKFQDAHRPVSSGELEKIGGFQSSFWRDWKQKLEEQKRIADHSRVLEQLIPDVDASRFLAKDTNYIETVVCALIDSVKLEKKVTSKDLQKLAYTYDLNLNKVLLQYTSSILVSEVWTIDDVTTEISEFKSKILDYSAETINTISLHVYPAIDGHNKQRLAYIYGLLSDCCLQVDDVTVLLPMLHPDHSSMNFGLANFYRIMEQECNRVSSINNLNFKNIAALSGLNMKSFSTEVYAHIDEHSVEALTIMVRNLVSIYGDPVKEEGLISWQSVYRHYILHVITTLELRAKSEIQFETPEKLHGFIDELELVYENCRKYLEDMGYSGNFDMIMRFFTVVAADSDSEGYITNDPIWNDCLISLLKFWLQVIGNAKSSTPYKTPEENCGVEFLMSSLQVFVRLVEEGRVSPVQGWGTIFRFVSHGCLTGEFTNSILVIFCRGLVFSGCGFGVVEEIYSEAVSQFDNNNTSTTLAELYSDILESLLLDLAAGCHVQDNLHSLLSSLSRMEGNLENLKSVRHSIWNKMSEFSDNLELPSNARVCALELMQFITKASDPPQSSNAVLPWEGWVDLKITTQNRTNSQGILTDTLVALKSSQLLKSMSPNVEISAEDLSSVNSAVSCFSKLCGEVTSESHVDTLLAILAEWEGHYDVGSNHTTEPTDSGWDDDGWESFPEESNHNESLLHPLHLCWLEILKILVKQSRFKDIITVVDQSILKPNGMLLNQDDADCLSKIALEVNCFAAVKIALLFPYETISLRCLDAVEEKLKRDGIQETTWKDHEFLVLTLSSGIISTIISNPKYGSVFSYICYMVGYFSRQCQQAKLKGEVEENQNIEKDEIPIFRMIIFPCFVSELVKAEQKVLAGFLVTKIMHANASLSLINIAEASLKAFLVKQLKIIQGGNLVASSNRPLTNSLICLSNKLETVVSSAFSSVSAEVRR
ncbi:MAG2-interacting protein 2 [Impatiens glandulifera]|uniref:MAG2-interacting protein 2 n=1 Tax=Impatiens glandulifera TaxID=253017 RepID=UPI001FB05C45|nr:MAG2-interacting protein 2 [Impatiens glandulifera]